MEGCERVKGKGKGIEEEKMVTGKNINDGNGDNQKSVGGKKSTSRRDS